MPCMLTVTCLRGLGVMYTAADHDGHGAGPLVLSSGLAHRSEGLQQLLPLEMDYRWVQEHALCGVCCV